MNELGFAVQVLVLGFAVVIVTLFALYVLLILFNRIFYRKNSVKDNDHVAVHSASSLENKNRAELSDAGFDAAKDTDKKRVVAAIIAAVSCYLESDGVSAVSAPYKISVYASAQPQKSHWEVAGRRRALQKRSQLEQIRRRKQHENI